MILPGQAQDLELRVDVDRDTAAALNRSDSSLVDIVMLHVVNGKDYFLSVSGSYSEFIGSLGVIQTTHPGC